MSFELAKVHKSLRCVVQDLPSNEVHFRAALPEALEGRVTWQAHDFFQEQPTKGADVYLLRHVLHDWSDEYARKILRNLVPALGPKSRILVGEIIMRPAGTVAAQSERMLTSLDLYMMVMVNAKERSEKQWVRLFKDVDARFKMKSIGNMPGPGASVLEFVLDDSEYPN